ncbi:AraC family transcriptional regulator (plasmid) [Fulvitalea axinellae]|uniref:AraC family transcriptional regulator n=1 Tax=Fulvitalea axinellae TaxID=1182444 RepID=A0AAU9DG25_9BACT|nr:AraC family transcriptional regulator [Fulvitalea axinellae]
MRTVLRGDIFEKKVIVKEFEDDFKTDSFIERDIVLDNEYEKGIVTFLQLDGIRVSIRRTEIQSYSLDVYHDFPFFKLQFEIEGSSLYTPEAQNEMDVYIPQGHYNLFYIPRVKGKLTYDTSYRNTLEIVFTERHLIKLLGHDFKESFDDLGNAIKRGYTFKLWNRSGIIDYNLGQCVKDIQNCGYEGVLKKAFLETKINELLLVLLAKTKEKDYRRKRPLLANQGKILEIEHYIRENLGERITISDLSQKFGINTSKLKHDFKLAFSTTIFKHITTLRMEKAIDLIQKHGHSVSEASYKVGYKNQQHFTVAFKKKYNLLPKTLMEEVRRA